MPAGFAERSIGIQRVEGDAVEVTIERIRLGRDIESAAVGVEDRCDVHQSQDPPRTAEIPARGGMVVNSMLSYGFDTNVLLQTLRMKIFRRIGDEGRNEDNLRIEPDQFGNGLGAPRSPTFSTC